MTAIPSCHFCGGPATSWEHRDGTCRYPDQVVAINEEEAADLAAFLERAARSLASGQWFERVRESREKARHDFEEDAALDGPSRAQEAHDAWEARGWQRK